MDFTNKHTKTSLFFRLNDGWSFSIETHFQLDNKVI